MTPASSGTIFFRIALSRDRSVSGSLRLMPGHRAVGYVYEVAPGQRHLRCQARTLVTDRVLRHLHQDRVAGLHGVLDASRLPVQAGSVPVHLAGIEHRVTAATDVDERCFHARQDVLHLGQVDVPDHGGCRTLRHVVLDENIVLQHGDLGPVALLSHDHDSVDGLAASEELRLSQDGRTAPTLFAAFTASLLLRFQARRALDTGDLVGGLAPLTNVHNGTGPDRRLRHHCRPRSLCGGGGGGGAWFLTHPRRSRHRPRQRTRRLWSQSSRIRRSTTCPCALGPHADGDGACRLRRRSRCQLRHHRRVPWWSRPSRRMQRPSSWPPSWWSSSPPSQPPPGLVP